MTVVESLVIWTNSAEVNLLNMFLGVAAGGQQGGVASAPGPPEELIDRLRSWKDFPDPSIRQWRSIQLAEHTRRIPEANLQRALEALGYRNTILPCTCSWEGKEILIPLEYYQGFASSNWSVPTCHWSLEDSHCNHCFGHQQAKEQVCPIEPVHHWFAHSPELLGSPNDGNCIPRHNSVYLNQLIPAVLCLIGSF